MFRKGLLNMINVTLPVKGSPYPSNSTAVLLLLWITSSNFSPKLRKLFRCKTLFNLSKYFDLVSF